MQAREEQAIHLKKKTVVGSCGGGGRYYSLGRGCLSLQGPSLLKDQTAQQFGGAGGPEPPTYQWVTQNL